LYRVINESNYGRYARWFNAAAALLLQLKIAPQDVQRSFRIVITAQQKEARDALHDFLLAQQDIEQADQDDLSTLFHSLLVSFLTQELPLQEKLSSVLEVARLIFCIHDNGGIISARLVTSLLAGHQYALRTICVHYTRLQYEEKEKYVAWKPESKEDWVGGEVVRGIEAAGKSFQE
jgi:hypothetical protein